MFATIRIYQDVEQKQEIARRVEEGFVPMMKETPGFRGWYVIDGGDGTHVSITFFDSLEATAEANEKSAEWIKQNDMSGLLPNPPEIVAGEVLRWATPGEGSS